MRRILNLCLVGFATVVSACWTMDMAASCINSLNPEMRDRAEHLDHLRTQVNAFHEYVDGILDEVAHGRLSLRDASQSLEEYAADHYPIYFASVAAMAPERPMRAKLASMLLHQFELNTIDGIGHIVSQQRRAQLNSEYAAINAK